jgi:thioredoxin reductase (NADPH)
MDVTVIGGGDSACEEALFLTRFCSKVTLVHRRDTLRASKIMAERTLAHDKIEVCWNATPEAVLADESGNARALQVTISDSGESKEIPCKGVFIAIGHIPNTDFVDGLLERDSNGYIIPSVGSQVRTSIDGLFAAGDCVDHVYRQAITAAGMGCQSAIEAERWLAEKE